MDKELIIETVSRLFVAVDNRDWNTVKSILDDRVQLDYTSMSGGKASVLKADQIIDSWKSLLPGFDQTHHQLGNWLVSTDSGSVKVFCYGTATHYLKNESENNLWTVVGSYDIEMKRKNEKWRITLMKFNLKYIDGNAGLPKLAQERLNKQRG